MVIQWILFKYYNIKRRNDNIQEKQPEFDEYIDIPIYKKIYFRLPNQTNNNKPLPHKVIRGDINDFIVNYIIPDTKKLPNKSIEANTK